MAKQLSTTVEAEKQRQRAAEAKERGRIQQEKTSLTDRYEPNLAWLVKIKLPFSYAASKNSLFGQKRYGGRFLKAESKQYRDSIAFLLKSALREHTVKNNKIWVDIHVEKPDHHGDAINVIDLVCDAIKLSIPVDDRWYCIRYLDWSINRNDPHLLIGLGQENIDDAKPCVCCGNIKPFSDFTKKSSSRDGRAGTCKSCRLR